MNSQNTNATENSQTKTVHLLIRNKTTNKITFVKKIKKSPTSTTSPPVEFRTAREFWLEHQFEKLFKQFKTMEQERDILRNAKDNIARQYRHIQAKYYDIMAEKQQLSDELEEFQEKYDKIKEEKDELWYDKEDLKSELEYYKNLKHAQLGEFQIDDDGTALSSIAIGNSTLWNSHTRLKDENSKLKQEIENSKKPESQQLAHIKQQREGDRLTINTLRRKEKTLNAENSKLETKLKREQRYNEEFLGMNLELKQNSVRNMIKQRQFMTKMGHNPDTTCACCLEEKTLMEMTTTTCGCKSTVCQDCADTITENREDSWEFKCPTCRNSEIPYIHLMSKDEFEAHFDAESRMNSVAL
jgi:DNA repair exonuclease SbcCD ATPase subunit